MNQILYTIENKEEKNRVKNIIIFFSVLLIIFGIVMVSMGGYNIASAKIAQAKAKEDAKLPEVSLNAEDNTVVVSVSHVREIKNIIYSWNNGEETILQGNNTNSIEEYIDVPAGSNTLNISVIDVEGKTKDISQEFTYEGTYMELSVVDSKSIKITVTDMAGLQNVTYKWNSGEDIIVYPDSDNSKSIEIMSNIPIGLNTITVSSINYNNVVQNKEMQVQGITKPTMKINFNEQKTLLKIKFNDDQGIQSYSYTLSSAPIVDIAENGNIIPEFKKKLSVVKSETKSGNAQKSITEELPFQEGFNYLEVTITNIEGVTETYTGWSAK